MNYRMEYYSKNRLIEKQIRSKFDPADRACAF